MRLLLVLLFAASLFAPVARAADATVTGTAAYRERMALPPNARFEAVILDASRADAASPVVAKTVIDGPGQSPIPFAIAYDPGKLDPRGRYVLRATISVDGALWFTTDTATPLPSGGVARVDLLLRRVAQRASPLAAAGGTDLLIGAYRYFADAATFQTCRTGREVPVAMEGGGYQALEAAYRQERPAPAAPLVATVEGGVESRAGMEGPPRPTLVVRRFLAAWPGETCARNRADAPLVNTYWRLAVLKGETLAPVEGRREGSLVLHWGPQKQAAATAGCNRMAGSYTTTGAGGLTFGQFASTMMACPPPLDARERMLAEVLAATRFYAVAGSSMVLYDEKREPLAVLQAVALR